MFVVVVMITGEQVQERKHPELKVKRLEEEAAAAKAAAKAKRDEVTKHVAHAFLSFSRL